MLTTCCATVQLAEGRSVIEKLLTPGSILELAMRHCVLREDTLRLFPIGAKKSTRCGGPA